MVEKNSFLKYKPVDFSKVSFSDIFWAPRLKTISEITMNHSYKMLVESGRIESLKLKWKKGMPYKPHKFYDSDVAKWVESAAYLLKNKGIKDEELKSGLKKSMDEIIDLFIKAQQKDGYINTYFTQVEPENRWKNLRDDHELYCAGHLIEAAVAHYEATKERKFLDALIKYADYIDSVFGTEEGKLRGYPGHEEIELALVRLYHATDDVKYLNLAKYFIDERGNDPDYFMEEALKRGEKLKGFGEILNQEEEIAGLVGDPRHYQNHLPVREQDEIVGHAVRAMYLYSGMADIAAEFGDDEILEALHELWDDTTLRKMYITGGVGSSRKNEGITRPFHLPNEKAYCETCAAIALVFWAHRMLKIELNAKFGDIMEKALYNNIPAALSLSGDKFFYENPLAVSRKHGLRERKPWYGCSCCPNNITRLFASLGKYMYSISPDKNELCIHLYAGNTSEFELGSVSSHNSESANKDKNQNKRRPVKVIQETEYPWDGLIKITFEPDITKDELLDFAVKFRIPGWCSEFSIRLESSYEGERLLKDIEQEDGYVTIKRSWDRGDSIYIDLTMQVEMMYANPKVEADQGRVALQRGPVIFCFEEYDNGRDLDNVMLMRNEPFDIFRDQSLGDIIIIETGGIRHSDIKWRNILYSPKQKIPSSRRVKLTAIPYCVWNNRKPGDMQVWIKEE